MFLSTLRGVDMIIIPILLKERKLSTEKLKNLPKITQLESGRTQSPAQAISRAHSLNSVH